MLQFLFNFHSRTALNYVYGLLADLVDPPHPDILGELCQTIGAKYPEHEPYHSVADLHIRWRCSGGFGKSHQAWFYIDPAILLLSR